jgi:hypothetical protein
MRFPFSRKWADVGGQPTYPPAIPIAILQIYLMTILSIRKMLDNFFGGGNLGEVYQARKSVA